MPVISKLPFRFLRLCDLEKTHKNYHKQPKAQQLVKGMFIFFVFIFTNLQKYTMLTTDASMERISTTTTTLGRGRLKKKGPNDQFTDSDFFRFYGD